MYVLCEKVEQLHKRSGKKLVEDMKDVLEHSPKLRAKLSDLYDSNGNYNESEVSSWEESLPCLFDVLYENGLDQLYAVIEYTVPNESERPDIVLLGAGVNGGIRATVVELKRWSTIYDAPELSNIDVKFSEGSEGTGHHPCDQIEEYMPILRKNHSGVQEFGIEIDGVAFLHNFKNKSRLFSNQYQKYKDKYEARTFTAGEEAELADYLNKRYRNEDIQGDKDLFLKSDFITSDDTMSDLKITLDGKDLEPLVKKQRPTCAKIMSAIRDLEMRKNDGYRLVIVVSGAAGTGKSILGFTVLSQYYELCKKKSKGLIYSTHNSTLRYVLESGISKKENGKFILPYNSVINDESKNRLLIVDEAQRLENVETDLQDLIQRCKILLLLQDDNQIIRITENGTCQNIKGAVQDLSSSGSDVSDGEYHECKNNLFIRYMNLTLKDRIRNGDGSSFGNLVDDFLSNKKPGKYPRLREDFEIKVESLKDIEADLEKYRYNNKCKWIAPYCWYWDQENEDSIDISFQDGDFKFDHPWNPRSEGSQVDWYKRCEADNRFAQVGCVYTTQGLDFDYVGLIVWDDLVWTNSGWKVDLGKSWDYRFVREIINQDPTSLGFWNKDKRSNDGSHTLNYQSRLKQKLKDVDMDKVTTLYLNSYRILFTRARKGIFIWFKDPGTKERFMEFLER